MKWLSDNNARITIDRRWMGNEESGIVDVYRLCISIDFEDNLYHWAYLIESQSIKYLQKYIELGIAAYKHLKGKNK